MTSKIEFAVQMKCKSCVSAVEKALKDVDGIKKVDIQLATGSVMVETTLPTDSVLKLLEKTGRKAVVKGSAGLAAGVAVIECGNANIQGVVRFMQSDDSTCIIDGTVDGLGTIPYSVRVHECGDLSNGCENVGNIYMAQDSGDQNYGIIGDITPDDNGRASFRFTNSNIRLSNIIGRSLVISESSDIKSNGKLACGIIARSAGLFQNPKTICACDGVSIWDEKQTPKKYGL